MRPELPALVSPLFVPGTRPERFAKAASSGADAIIIDLEDAVAPDAKEVARGHIAEYLERGEPALVRINARGTPYFLGDLTALKSAPPRGIVIPKFEDPVDAEVVRKTLGSAVAVVALIETARGVARMEESLPQAGVAQAAIGTLDLAADLDCDPDSAPVQLARAQIVLASRIAGLPAPIDGVTTDIQDHGKVGADAREARYMGFGGKLCIHPRQIKPILAAFRPSDSELDWARRVIEQRAKGVTVIDGQMIDAPVIRMAERILSCGID